MANLVREGEELEPQERSGRAAHGGGHAMPEALVDCAGGARCTDGSTTTAMAADAVDPRRGLRSEGGRGCRRG